MSCFWDHWYPCFAFLVTSPLGFKARVGHNAKLAIHEKNWLTIREQKNAIQNFYNPLLTEFHNMSTLFALRRQM